MENLRPFLLMPLLLSAPTQEACPQGTCSGDLTYYLSEVQASQTQPEPSTPVTNCLGLQPDQGFDSGNGFARQRLSSFACSFTANADSGTQCPSQGREGKGLGRSNPGLGDHGAVGGGETGAFPCSLMVKLKSMIIQPSEVRKSLGCRRKSALRSCIYLFLVVHFGQRFCLLGM